MLTIWGYDLVCFFENLDTPTQFVKMVSVKDDHGFDQARIFVGHSGTAGEPHPGRIYLYVAARKSEQFFFVSLEWRYPHS